MAQIIIIIMFINIVIIMATKIKCLTAWFIYEVVKTRKN